MARYTLSGDDQSLDDVQRDLARLQKMAGALLGFETKVTYTEFMHAAGSQRNKAKRLWAALITYHGLDNRRHKQMPLGYLAALDEQEILKSLPNVGAGSLPVLSAFLASRGTSLGTAKGWKTKSPLEPEPPA